MLLIKLLRITEQGFFMERIDNIKIKRSSIDDDFYMPLADISFNIGSHPFQYFDYINPFTNGVADFFVTRTFTRHGDEKIKLCQDIADRLAIELNVAVDLFSKLVSLLNRYVRENSAVQAEFPTFNEVMRLANQNGFSADNQISLNFMCYRQNVEMHIRAKTVESAKQQFLEYEKDRSVSEEYTQQSVQHICNQYPGLRVVHNKSGSRPEKPWILLEKLTGPFEKPYYFDTLRDIAILLPLPHHYQNHEEPYHE
jgi:hypothetical protein